MASCTAEITQARAFLRFRPEPHARWGCRLQLKFFGCIHGGKKLTIFNTGEAVKNLALGQVKCQWSG